MTTTTSSASVYGTTYGGSAPENYERFFVPAIGGPLAADLVAAAELRPGERVLDVACGTGVVTRLAAAGVGRSGTVAAVDLNPGMLAMARSLAPAEAPRIQWYETTAEAMPLPSDAFDVVFCQLGLQFMEDKPAAVREMRRVLAPGGRALVTVPTPTPFFDVLDHAFERHVPGGAVFVRMVFSLNDRAVIEQLFEDAGFRDIVVRPTVKILRLPSPREFLWQYIESTPLVGLVAAADGARVAALERDVVEGWQPWARDGGLTYEQALIVTTARR